MNACVLWPGTRTAAGYGQLRVGGVQVYAHRALYESVYGPIPAGLVVRHKCDVPACVNVEHLEIGAQRDNVQDAFSRGRIRSGERHGMAKLSADDVRDIRSRYAAGGLRQRDFAIEYGVSTTLISRILNRKNWKDV